MNEIRFILSAVLMAASLVTLCTGVLGAWRFRHSLNRLHAASVNDTLGLLLACCSLIIAAGLTVTSLKYLMILVLLWIASPLSSHLIARLEVTTSPDLSSQLTKETLPPDKSEREEE